VVSVTDPYGRILGFLDRGVQTHKIKMWRKYEIEIVIIFDIVLDSLVIIC
jgi:hypothetical protein